jgi:hypothetical protein
VAEHPGTAPWSALRRGDEGPAARVPRGEDAHAHDPHRGHQAQRGLPRALPRERGALLRTQRPGPRHGRPRGTSTARTVAQLLINNNRDSPVPPDNSISCLLFFSSL